MLLLLLKGPSSETYPMELSTTGSTVVVRSVSARASKAAMAGSTTATVKQTSIVRAGTASSSSSRSQAVSISKTATVGSVATVSSLLLKLLTLVASSIGLPTFAKSVTKVVQPVSSSTPGVLKKLATKNEAIAGSVLSIEFHAVFTMLLEAIAGSSSSLRRLMSAINQSVGGSDPKLQKHVETENQSQAVGSADAVKTVQTSKATVASHSAALLRALDVVKQVAAGTVGTLRKHVTTARDTLSVAAAAGMSRRISTVKTATGAASSSVLKAIQKKLSAVAGNITSIRRRFPQYLTRFASLFIAFNHEQEIEHVLVESTTADLAGVNTEVVDLRGTQVDIVDL